MSMANIREVAAMRRVTMGLVAGLLVLVVACSDDNGDKPDIGQPDGPKGDVAVTDGPAGDVQPTGDGPPAGEAKPSSLCADVANWAAATPDPTEECRKECADGTNDYRATCPKGGGECQCKNFAVSPDPQGCANVTDCDGVINKADTCCPKK